MASTSTLRITYWGVTGTLPAPLRPEEVTAKFTQALLHLLESDRLTGLRPGLQAAEQVRQLVQEQLPFHLRATFGGNTTCLEVQTPDALIILDAGSGLRELGGVLERRWNEPGYAGPREAHLLLSHPHLDHWCALPFADCLYDPRNRFTLYGSESVLLSLSALLCADQPLSHSYFPPDYDLLKALRNFRVLTDNCSFHIGDTHVRTLPLHHPGGCMGFRLDHGGRSFVFATDHEQLEVPDRHLADFARGADLLYLDGQYLAAEYEGQKGIMSDPPLARRGWGHSSVEACTATAAAAGVRELHIGHREPRRDDNDLARVEVYARELLRQELLAQGREPDACQTRVPYEGLTIEL